MPESDITAGEVAELLRINADTVYALIAKDGLPTSKIGGQWRFAESEVREWFKHRRNPTTFEKPCGLGKT